MGAAPGPTRATGTLCRAPAGRRCPRPHRREGRRAVFRSDPHAGRCLGMLRHCAPARRAAADAAAPPSLPTRARSRRLPAPARPPGRARGGDRYRRATGRAVERTTRFRAAARQRTRERRDDRHRSGSRPDRAGRPARRSPARPPRPKLAGAGCEGRAPAGSRAGRLRVSLARHDRTSRWPPPRRRLLGRSSRPPAPAGRPCRDRLSPARGRAPAG